MKTAEKNFFISYSHIQLASVLHDAGKKRLVICSHGFTGNKTEKARLFVTVARELAKAGISVLRFDFMGSGDSSGEFYNMSPNTEIRDLTQVIQWAQKQGYETIGLLGMSFGGAITICTAAQLKCNGIKTIITWSAVPSFKFWLPKPTPDIFDRSQNNPIHRVGMQFYTDRPVIDVPESYLMLSVPKLQIQGSEDIPGFRENFEKFFTKAPSIKKHIVVPKANHTFDDWSHRKIKAAETVKWFKKYL